MICFARASLLHHVLSATQDVCDWFKEIQTGQSVSPDSRMMMCGASSFFSADTALWILTNLLLVMIAMVLLVAFTGKYCLNLIRIAVPYYYFY